MAFHSQRRPAGVQKFSYAEPALYGYQGLVEAAVDAARGSAKAPVTGAEALHDLRVVFGLYGRPTPVGRKFLSDHASTMSRKTRLEWHATHGYIYVIFLW